MSKALLVEAALSDVRGDLGVASYLLHLLANDGADEIGGRKLDPTETLLMLARVLREDGDRLDEAHRIVEMLPANALDGPNEAL